MKPVRQHPLRASCIALCLALLAAVTGTTTSHAAEPTWSPELEALVARLADADFPTRREIVTSLSALREERVRPLLAAFLEGQLVARASDGRVLISTGTEDAPVLADALTGESVDPASAGELNRIGTNNQLRRQLRGALARFDLSSDDADRRLTAVNEMLRGMDEDGAQILRDLVDAEEDGRVRERMQLGIALADLASDEPPTRLDAVRVLRESLNPDAFNRLTELAGNDADEQVRAAAAEAIGHIGGWRRFYGVIETLFFGLSLGSVLVLGAIGLAITFGVMGVINMAHGELMMIGAYTVFVVQQLMPQAIGASVLVAIPVAFLVSGLVGVAIERGIVRHLYGRPLETLLATFGVSLVLQQLARDLFTANNRPVETPAWLAGSLPINEVLSLTYTRLYIILFAAIVFAMLILILRRTRLGLEVRAVSQNRAMAKCMGIRTEWVDAMTFGLGSGVAGVAGVALSQLTNVGPNLGQAYIIDSFMVVVFGGVGSLWGTQIGGLTLGVTGKVLEPWVGAVLAKILLLVFLILFIQRRPRGLFPQKGRAAES